MTLFRKPADREDGRLISQSNHLVRVWMPVSFMDSERERERERERSKEELKSKCRIERERQWGSK